MIREVRESREGLNLREVGEKKGNVNFSYIIEVEIALNVDV